MIDTTVTATAGRPAATATQVGRPRPLYLRLWRNVPRELGYLVPTFVIAWIVSQLLLAAMSVSAGLLFLVVGLMLVPFILLGAAYAGRFEVLRLRATRLPAIAEPSFPRPFAGKPFLRALLDIAANPHRWLAYLHGALVAPILATVTGTLLFVWASVAVGFLAAPFGFFLHPFRSGERASFGEHWIIARPADGLFPSGPGSVPVDGWNVADLLTYGWWGDRGPGATTLLVLLTVLAGLGMVALLPFLTRGFTWAHWGAARVLLSRFPSEDATEEVSALRESRRAAVVAEDQALRRLERDIHDGPQQRLLRLQLDLASAERRFGDDPESARELLASARLLTKDTLDELRALTQGFAPPILQDRGLAAALESLGGRSVIPVTTSVDLAGVALPSEIERGAYFVAAELVSNAVKHAGAGAITLDASVRPGTADVESQLVLRVEDDGHGGAVTVPGHGLAGLTERLLGLQGALTIESPSGGPTTVTATIPLPASAADARRRDPLA